eukprot:EC712799.1.p2 GENE.EC712799.1~~EC712799.1.p2  ORF type:complete len:60 (+),score=5.35 EC712799.1:39-218(+)
MTMSKYREKVMTMSTDLKGVSSLERQLARAQEENNELLRTSDAHSRSRLHLEDLRGQIV